MEYNKIRAFKCGMQKNNKWGQRASMGEEDYVIPHEVFLKIERRPDKFRYYSAIYVVVKHCIEYAEAEQYAAARREYLSLLSALKEQFL